MPGGQVAGEFLQGTLVEHVGDQAHFLVDGHLAAIAGDDAGAFLAAVLQGVEPEVDELGGVLVAEHAADAAFVAGSGGKVGVGRVRVHVHCLAVVPGGGKKRKAQGTLPCASPFVAPGELRKGM